MLFTVCFSDGNVGLLRVGGDPDGVVCIGQFTADWRTKNNQRRWVKRRQ